MQTSPFLAQPIRLDPLTSSNRIVMPPLVIWKADRTGNVTDEHCAHYERSTGPGLMIVEATTIAPEGRLAPTQLGIWEDAHVRGLSRLARVVHDSGALAGIQIHHAGGSATLESTYGLAPRVPSLLERSPEGATELTDAEIERIIGAFRQATRRAIEAGFDLIELHGAHGYLISQFLSPGTNRRNDRWGGSAEKRCAFMVETVRAAREEIDSGGRSSPTALTIRLGIAASAPHSLTVEEGLAAARAAVEAGVDLIDVSSGGRIDDELDTEIRERAASVLTGGDAETLGRFTSTLLLAAIVKSSVSAPIIGVNGITTPEEAVTAIEIGIADMVAVGRGILADPGWAKKALGIVQQPIEPCLACKPRCFWFKEPPRCPARKRLAAKGEQPAVA